MIKFGLLASPNRSYYEVLDSLSMFESVPMEVLEFVAANEDFGKRILVIHLLRFDDC